MVKDKDVINLDQFLRDVEACFCPRPSEKDLTKFLRGLKLVYEKKADRKNYDIFPVKTMPIRTDCCNFSETEGDGKYCEEWGDGSQSISLERGCIKNCILYHKKHKPSQ